MALRDVIIGYAKGDKGDKGDKGERGATGQTGPQGAAGNIADAEITDTQGLDVSQGAKTTAQKLFDAIADRIVNKLVTNEILTERLAAYLLKSAMSNTNINSASNVPTSALLHSLISGVNAKVSALDGRVTQINSEMTKINFSKQAYNTADIKDCNDIPVNNFILAFSTATHKPIQSQVFAIFCIGNDKDNLKAQYGFCISQSEPIYSRIWNPNTNWSDWIAMGK